MTDLNPDKDLIDAAKAGDVAAVKRSIAAGADIDLARDGMKGTPALHCAVIGGHGAVIDALLDAGANIEGTYMAGKTPLHMAAWHGRTAIALALLTKGAQLEARDNDGRTALSFAAMHGHADTVRALITAGANIHNMDDSIGTPLHWAAWEGDTETIQSLLDAGADTKTTNRHGGTALGIAKGGGKSEAAFLLSEGERKSRHGWKAQGDDQVAHIHEFWGHELTEVFNFASRERVTFARNLETGAESNSRCMFDEVPPADLAKAAEELRKQGGRNHTAKSAAAVA